MKEVQSVDVQNSSDWGLVLLQGIAAVMLGIFLVAAPGATLLIVATLLGVYWLISGVLSIVKIFTGTSHLNWFWSLAVGVLGIFAGVIVLRHPVWSSVLVPTVLIVVLGINALFMSALNLIRGFGGDGIGYVAISVFDLVLGIILLTSPLLAASVLPVVFGILALIGGASTILFSFAMRGSERKEDVREQTMRRAA